MSTHTTAGLPTPGQRVRRALRLRCPECGSGGLFRHWLRLKPRCPACGLLLDRGNPDHFVGAYLVNLIIAELLFGVGLALWLVLVWPDVPWGSIEVVAVAAMILSPLLTYPFTRTVWLAADLVFDAPKPSDR
jgi:uncharacterized protein (DUF983 family)